MTNNESVTKIAPQNGPEDNPINPQDKVPDSLAEATTAPLDDDALGGHATQDDAK
ncbi:MAG: hypothetical protein Q4P13_04435 [Psychrobacter sp.]|nr:hypothetical protein [Psychrobacter sp.]